MKINIFFLLFSLNSFARSQDLKDILYECYDFDCQVPISWGKTLQMYSAKSDKHLSFNRNEDVIVVAKPGDKTKDDEGYVAIIRGKVGLVPPSMIREDRMGKKRLLQRYPFQFLPIWTEELTNEELMSSEQIDPDNQNTGSLPQDNSNNVNSKVDSKVNAENESTSGEEIKIEENNGIESEVVDGTTFLIEPSTTSNDQSTPGLSNENDNENDMENDDENEGDSADVESQETASESTEAASSELPFPSDSNYNNIPTPSSNQIDLNVESSGTQNNPNQNNQDSLHHPNDLESDDQNENNSTFEDSYDNNNSLSNDFDLDDNNTFSGENETEEFTNQILTDEEQRDSQFNQNENEQNETDEEEEILKKSIEIEIPSLPPAPFIDDEQIEEATSEPLKENEPEMENNPMEGFSESFHSVKHQEPKPIESKPIEVKPIEVIPIEVKPIEVKSIEPKPIEIKPIEVEPEILKIKTPEITTETPVELNDLNNEQVPILNIEIESTPPPLTINEEEEKSSFFGLYDTVTKWFSSDDGKKDQENTELNNQIPTEVPNDQIGESNEKSDDNQTAFGKLSEKSLPTESNGVKIESQPSVEINPIVSEMKNEMNGDEKVIEEKKEIVDPIDDMMKSRSSQQHNVEETTPSPIIHDSHLNEDNSQFTTPEPEMTSPIPRVEKIHSEHNHAEHHHHHPKEPKEESKSSILLIIKHLSSTLLQFLPEHLQDTILDVDDALVFSGIIALTLISICVPYFFIEGFFAVRPLKKKVVELNKNLWKVRSAYENQQEEFAHFKEKALAYDEDKNRIEELEFELEIVKKLEGKQKEQVRVLQKEIKHSARVASQVENLVETTLEAKDKAVEEKEKLKSGLTKVQELLRKTTEESEHYQGLYSNLSMDFELERHAVETFRLKNEAYENELKDIKGKLAAEVDLREKAEDEIDLLSNEKSQLHEETLDLKRILAQYESTVSNLNSEIGHRESELAGLKELLGEDSPLVEISEIRNQLLVAQEESISLASRLEAANLEKSSLLKRVEASDEELFDLRSNKDTAENRLHVLEQWFKEKEDELKGVVAKYEAEKSVRGRDKDDLILLIEEKDEEISQLLQRTDALKTEHEEAKTAHRAEMRALESKGHENWLSLCQSERKAQDYRKEAEILRQRLLALTKEKDFLDNQDGGSVNGDGGLFGSLIPPELVPLPIDEMIDPFFGSDFLPPPPLPLGEEDHRPPPVGRFSPTYSDEDITLSPISRSSRRPNNLSDTRSSRSNSPPSGGRRGSWRRRQRPGGPITSSPVNQ